MVVIIIVIIIRIPYSEGVTEGLVMDGKSSEGNEDVDILLGIPMVLCESPQGHDGLFGWSGPEEAMPSPGGS